MQADGGVDGVRVPEGGRATQRREAMKMPSNLVAIGVPLSWEDDIGKERKRKDQMKSTTKLCKKRIRVEAERKQRKHKTQQVFSTVARGN